MKAGFTDVQPSDVARLIERSPLCWIVPHADPSSAILMPVVAECGATGGPETLLGHLPRTSPAAAMLRKDPRASVLFLGANGYVSPAVAQKSNWAPTWNFVSARASGTVTLDDALTREAVEALVVRMEGTDGWRPTELGKRYEQLLARIVGFCLEIEDLAPRFKLGQDEDMQVAAAIREAFTGTALAEWMGRGNER